MIIALLVLIIFILLFGAGVVKGWLTNAAALITGFAILVGLVLWVGSFFGQDGPIYIILGGGALLTAFAFWAQTPAPTKPRAAEPKPIEPTVRFHSRAPTREERKKLRDQ